MAFVVDLPHSPPLPLWTLLQWFTWLTYLTPLHGPFSSGFHGWLTSPPFMDPSPVVFTVAAPEEGALGVSDGMGLMPVW